MGFLVVEDDKGVVAFNTRYLRHAFVFVERKGAGYAASIFAHIEGMDRALVFPLPYTFPSYEDAEMKAREVLAKMLRKGGGKVEIISLRLTQK